MEIIVISMEYESSILETFFFIVIFVRCVFRVYLARL